MNEETSAYWRKILEIDKPDLPDFLKSYQTWHRFFRPLFYALVGFLLRFYCSEKVYGIENLPEKPPYIIAANHTSFMDFVAMAWAMGKRKEELYPLTANRFYDNPWTFFWIKVAANAIRIDAVEEFFPGLRTAVKILKAQKAVYINPEGKVSFDGKLLPFRIGVGVLAVETGVPLVPVYLHNTGKALPIGSIFLRPYPILVSIGKPVEMKPYQEKLKTVKAYDIYKEVTEELKRNILELAEAI